MCEQVEQTLVQLDHAITRSCELYKPVVLGFERRRDESQRKEEESEDWSPQHPGLDVVE